MALRVVVGYAILTALTILVPAAYQRLVVQANELSFETPQIAHHIAATRRAWGIADVQLRELGAGHRADPRRRSRPTARRSTTCASGTASRCSRRSGSSSRSARTTTSSSVDDDRYPIGGQIRQVMLSAREMNTDALPTKGFINEHLTYTHGMGLTLGPSNEVTAEGLPVLFIKDLPPVSSIALPITRPQIYYGEQSNDFVLAPSRQREFDYPAGEGDAAVYSSYDGRGGVPVASFAARLLYALHFGSFNILLSRDVTDRTRILYNRSIGERARRALPFLMFDRDPYMVIAADGRLKWMLDALHDDRPLPVLAAGAERRRLHAQRGEGRDRRLRRRRRGVRRRAGRSDRADAGAHLSRPAAPVERDARRPARAPALSGGSVPRADGALRDVSHGQPGDVLPPRGSVAGAGRRRHQPAERERARVAGGADRRRVVPPAHRDAPSRRAGAGVHPHAAVHAAAEGQPRGLDGGAERRRATTASSPCTASRGRASCSARTRSPTGSTRTPRSRARSRSGISAAPRCCAASCW